MPQVDFHVLPGSLAAERFACQYAAEAGGRGELLYIQAESREDADHLDRLLWTFHDISFLPHVFKDDPDAEACPVVIGWGPGAPNPGRVLLNLGMDVPAFAADCRRVVEVAPSGASQKSRARERYRRYRELGFELQTIEVGNTHEHA